MTDTDIISECETRRYEAMVNCDLAVLDELMANDMVYIHSDGRREDKEAFLSALRSGNAKYNGVERNNETVRFFGPTAVVMVDLDIHYVKGGRERIIRSRAMAVWSRIDELWLLVALQSASRE